MQHRFVQSGGDRLELCRLCEPVLVVGAIVQLYHLFITCLCTCIVRCLESVLWVSFVRIVDMQRLCTGLLSVSDCFLACVKKRIVRQSASVTLEYR